MLSDLTAFLNARLDEDEAAAKAAHLHFPGPWDRADAPGSPLPAAVSLYDRRGECFGVIRGSYAAAHIALHDPARALREVELGREIIGQYAASVRSFGEGLSVPNRRLALLLAAVWSGHPDYRDDWG